MELFGFAWDRNIRQLSAECNPSSTAKLQLDSQDRKQSRVNLAFIHTLVKLGSWIIKHHISNLYIQLCCALSVAPATSHVQHNKIRWFVGVRH